MGSWGDAVQWVERIGRLVEKLYRDPQGITWRYLRDGW